MAGIVPIKWKPGTGGLNSNFGYEDIQGGDLVSARNVRSLGGDINQSPDYIPIKGNLYQYTPSAPAPQNEILRIKIVSDGTAMSFITSWVLIDQNGREVCNFSSLVDGLVWANTVTDFDTNLTAALPAGYSYTISDTPIDAYSGYIDIEMVDIPGMTALNGWNWYLTESVADNIVITVSQLQEGIDASMIGLWHLAGSYDLLGDDFQIWTTGTSLPNTYNITDAFDDGTGLIEIEIIGHTFVAGDSIKVYGIIGTNDLDIDSTGLWIISSVTISTVVLAASAYPGGAAYTSGGTAVQGYKKLTEMGVAVENINTDTIDYTRLLRTSEWDVRTRYQVDMTGDIQNQRKNLYFTDDNNAPRCFYYKGLYITDGAIKAINPDGYYSYGSIESETSLILTNDNRAILTYDSQSQQGGNLRSGNKVYYFRFLTDNLTPTQWSEPTNPVNVYAANTGGDALELKGDAENVFTGKINNLLLSNIPVGVYLYVELAVVEYIGASFMASIIRRELLSGEVTQTLQHNGYETNVTEIDAGTLNIKYSNIKTARNISILNSRLILSNLTYQQLYDFSEFCKTWRHTINKTEISRVDNEMNNGYKFGEYFDMVNVNNFTGYMLNDCYRFMARFKLKKKYGGGTTLAFWVDDIVIDCETFNIDPAYPDSRRDVSATATTYDLTTQYAAGVEPNPYVWYVNLHSFNLDYPIDGVPFRELVDYIIIDRAERVPEVLGSGYISPGVSGVLNLAFGTNWGYLGTVAPVTGEYPFYSGMSVFVPPDPDYPTATNAPNAYVAETDFGFIHCVDWAYGVNIPTFRSGDGVIIFGNPEKSMFYPKAGPGLDNQYTHYNGAHGITAKPALNPFIDAKYLAFNEVSSLSARDVSNKLTVAAATTFWGNQANYAVNVTNPIADGNTLGNTDYGFYLAQYYRPISTYDALYAPDSSKYGIRENTKSLPTGTYFFIDATTPSIVGASDISVFGGDVFTQKTFYKHRYPVEDTLGITADLGMGGGVAFYSQNTINSQMRRKFDDTIVNIYPKTTLLDWLQEEDTTVHGLDPALSYNFGYTNRNIINRSATYNSNIEDNTDLGASIAWSDIKIDGALNDNFRVFLPLNIKNLSKSDGDITHHTTSNGELLTFQPRRTMRQFFNTTGMLSTLEGSEVILGDGGVMTRPGQTLSSFGSNHKWSHVKGKTQGGHDVDYIFDIENKTIIRLGLDGTIDEGIRANYSAFLAKYTKWVTGQDTPAYNWGICSVWYQKTKEAIWTFRGKKVVAEFDAGIDYPVGSVIQYSLSSTWNTFEQVDDIFIALTDVPAGSVPDTSPLLWERASIDNPDYFSYFTLVWSEIKNKFQCHHEYHPFIYAKMNNYFLSPRPIGDFGRMYWHEKGNYCEWYDDGATKQTGDYYIEPVINAQVEVSKDAVSLMLESVIAPKLTEVRTNTHKTHMDDTDYTERESAWVVPVMMDEAVTTKNPLGSNKGDGSRVFGKFVRIKFQGETNTYNEWKSFVLRTRLRDRMFNK